MTMNQTVSQRRLIEMLADAKSEAARVPRDETVYDFGPEEIVCALTELLDTRANNAEPVAGDDAETELAWRNLALQFDAHRISALSLLRAFMEGIELDEVRGMTKAFLAAPPLSGEKVLAHRIAALSATSA